MHRSLLASLAVLAALLIVACGTARPPRPARSFDDRPEGVVLDYPNGLRLVVAPDLSGDLVRVHMRVRAGSRNETNAQAGLAHFAEHVVLCALRLPDGRTACDALAEETLAYRATTDGDTISFSATTVAAHLPTVLGLFAFVLAGTCDVSPEQFARERNVVLSELQLRMGASVDAVHELLASVYPPTHPYAHFAGGTRDSLARMTADDVCGYVRDRFTPGNAALVVTGGVAREQVERAADSTLRPLAARRTSPQIAAPPVAPGRGARRTLAGLVPGSGTALVFPLPPRHSDDGRLAQILVDMVDRAVADAAPTFAPIHGFDVEQLGGADAPMLALFATTGQPESRAATEELLWQAIATVLQHTGERDRFEALRRRLRIDTARRFERLDARAERYLELEPHARRGALASDLRRVDALTSAALARVARDVLARERAWVFELTPSGAADGVVLRDVTRLPDDAHTVRAAPTIAAKLLAELPAANRGTRYTLANGLIVVLAPSSSPLVDVRLIVDAGIADAPDDRPQLALVAAVLLDPADGSPAGQDLQRLRDAGASIDLTVGPDLTIFQARGLATDTDHLLRGLGGVVVDGRHSADARSWAEHQVYQALVDRDRAEPPRRRLARAALDRCYDLDAGFSDPLGLQELDEFRRKHYRAGAATLIVAGGFDEAVARAHIDDVLGRTTGAWGQTAPASVASTRPTPAVRPGVSRLELSQSHQVSVLLGFVVPPELRRDRATVLLLRQLLENAGGEVRERLGISYGFSVTLDLLCGAEMLLIDGNIDAAHLAAGVGELRRAFARLRTPEGVAAAQRPVAGRLLAEAADSQVLADRLAFLVEQKLPLDYFRSEARRVLEMNPQRLADVLTASLAPDRLVAVCLGPSELTGPCDDLHAPWQDAE